MLADLEKIEAKFGDDFSFVESAVFYQARGAVRLEAKDYRGALDDLKAAMRGGLDPDSATSTYDTIMQLEAFVAAQDRGEGTTQAPAPNQPDESEPEGSGPAQTPAPTATTPKA